VRVSWVGGFGFGEKFNDFSRFRRVRVFTRALNLLFKLQAVCECARVYDVCNTPSSYRQPSGNGQFLSRRYCKHSVWFFSCASSTAR